MSGVREKEGNSRAEKRARAITGRMKECISINLYMSILSAHPLLVPCTLNTNDSGVP